MIDTEDMHLAAIYNLETISTEEVERLVKTEKGRRDPCFPLADYEVVKNIFPIWARDRKMDRNEFIKGFEKASSHFDMDRTMDIMKKCIRRQTTQNPDTHRQIVPIVVMEECAELTEAVSRKIRGRDTDNYSLLEEMADVMIDILSLLLIYDISREDLVKAINVKLDREEGRIREWEADRKNRLKNICAADRTYKKRRTHIFHMRKGKFVSWPNRMKGSKRR